MNLHLLVASFSGLFFAGSGVIYKITNKHLINDPLRQLFLFFWLRAIFLLILLPFVKVSLSLSLWPYLLLYSLSFFLGSLLTGLGLVHLDASIFMPLYNLQVIFTPLIAFFFLGERLPLLAYLLFLLIILGGSLVTFSEDSKRRRRWFEWLLGKVFGNKIKFSLIERPSQTSSLLPVIVIFVLGLIFYSFSDNFAGKLLQSWDVLSLTIGASFIHALLSLFLLPFIKTTETVNFNKIWPIFVGGLFGFLGLLAINTGFAYSVSLSQALSRLSSVYTIIIVVILARFKGEFLEKHPAYVYAVRFLGSGVMVTAAISLLLIK